MNDATYQQRLSKPRAPQRYSLCVTTLSREHPRRMQGRNRQTRRDEDDEDDNDDNDDDVVMIDDDDDNDGHDDDESQLFVSNANTRKTTKAAPKRAPAAKKAPAKKAPAKKAPAKAPAKATKSTGRQATLDFSQPSAAQTRSTARQLIEGRTSQ